MQETYNTKAIILNRQDFREKDSLVTIYSSDSGKMSLVARGTKNIKSKLAGHLEPMSLVDVMVVRGKKFDYIGTSVTRDCFLNIKRDLEKVKIAGKAIVYFKGLVRENDGGELFSILINFLQFLNADFRLPISEIVYYNFILKLLATMGHKPELECCVGCRSKINQERIIFDFLKGGLVCGSCSQKSPMLDRDRLALSSGCVNLLNIILNSNKFEFREENKITAEAVNFIGLFSKFQGG